MIRLGPYTFSQHDAVRTVAKFADLWSPMVEGRTSERALALGAAWAERGAHALGLAAETPLADVAAASRGLDAASPVLHEMLADAWSTLLATSDALREDGQLPVGHHGTVTQLSTSKGGVPKLAIDAVEVDFRGVVGDTQRVRVHHGRPWQALCLFADEVIDELRAEGHPIGRGSTGENITVAGLDWTVVRPGVQIRVGTVLALVQAYAQPCRSNARWFLGGDFDRMNIERGPVSRVYATVLRPGRIVTGDAIVVEPAA